MDYPGVGKEKSVATVDVRNFDDCFSDFFQNTFLVEGV